MLKSKNCYVLWTVSMCTTSLQSKFCKIVLWYERTRIIWMNYLFKLFCTSCHPGSLLEPLAEILNPKTPSKDSMMVKGMPQY